MCFREPIRLPKAALATAALCLVDLVLLAMNVDQADADLLVAVAELNKTLHDSPGISSRYGLLIFAETTTLTLGQIARRIKEGLFDVHDRAQLINLQDQIRAKLVLIREIDRAEHGAASFAADQVGGLHHINQLVWVPGKS